MLMGTGGSSGVTVKTAVLLEVLKKNRSAHTNLYLEAATGYRAAAIEAFEKMIAEANGGLTIRRHLDLEEPEDHTKEYDLAIRKLELCVKEEIFISDSEFASFVMDDWNWKANFIGTTSNYTNRGR